jgi:lysozyme
MLKPAFVDLSHHNVIPASLKPAKQAGILGVIHKMTEGWSFVDGDVDARFVLAKDAELLWGIYHFIRPGNIISQAEFFVNKAIELGVADDDTLFCLDYEDKGVSVDDCVHFMEIVEDMTSHQPVLYSGHVLKEALGGKANANISKYRLWIAQYGPEAVLPPGWDHYWGWQYTEDGHCAGIQPPVDLNAYWGTAHELKSDWAKPITGVDPSVSTVTITIDAPDDVEVVVVRKGV